MRPVRTRRSNSVYVGPPGVMDLPAETAKISGATVVSSVWHLSPTERRQIAEGADLELAVFASGIPPVRLQLTNEPGIGEDAADVLDRLDQLREASR